MCIVHTLGASNQALNSPTINPKRIEAIASAHRGRGGSVLWVGLLFAALCAVAGWGVFSGYRSSESDRSGAHAERKATGHPQLVSVQPLPELETTGEMCEWMPASSPARLAFALQQGGQGDASEERNISLERLRHAVECRLDVILPGDFLAFSRVVLAGRCPRTAIGGRRSFTGPAKTSS